VGAGIGYSWNKVEDIQIFGNDWEKRWDSNTRGDTSWSITAGAYWEINDRIGFDFGGEYRNAGHWELIEMPPTLDETIRGDLDYHMIWAGLRVNF